MATNTPNYNLVKPELNDFADIRVLNGNMDIIDAQLKKASDIDLSNYATKTELNNYMPVTGGNFTGDITIKNNQVVSIVDSWYNDDKSQYWIKYSDGRLEQQIVIDNTQTGGRTPNIVNLLTPYINTDYQVIVFQETHSINPILLYDINVTYGVDHPAEQAGTTPKEKNKFTIFTDTNSLVRLTCIGRWKE